MDVPSQRLHLIKYTLKGFLLGQILALFQCGTGVTSELLTNNLKVIHLFPFMYINHEITVVTDAWGPPKLVLQKSEVDFPSLTLWRLL